MSSTDSTENEPKTTPAEPSDSDIANITVKAADMDDDVLDFVKRLAIEAVSKYDVESQVAAYIKKEMDAKHGMLWHCIAGIGFGSYVTHVRRGFCHLKIQAPHLKAFNELGLGNLQEKWCFVLLFKTA